MSYVDIYIYIYKVTTITKPYHATLIIICVNYTALCHASGEAETKTSEKLTKE